MPGRTTIMAIIGGTFAKLGGGKFANGAMSAAFVHLFNYEYKDAVRTKRILEAKGYKGLRIEYGNHGKNSYYVKDERGFIYGGYLPEEIKQAESFGRALMIPYGVGGGLLRGGYMFTMMHPEVTIGTGVLIENLDGYYGGTSPSLNICSAINGFEMSTGIQIVPDSLKP